MPDYLTLLGRINVGGHTVTMARLRELVAELGHTGVGTYIQTGNVFFTSPAEDPDALAAQLSRHLSERLGYDVPAFVRTTDELAAALATEPFRDVAVNADTRLMVLVLDRGLPAGTAFPVSDEARGFTLLGVHGREAFVVLRLVNGRPGNVVAWVEKVFCVRASGRFAHTLAAMLAKRP